MDAPVTTAFDESVLNGDAPPVREPAITVTRIGDAIRTSWDKEIDPYAIPALLRHAALQIEKTVLGG